MEKCNSLGHLLNKASHLMKWELTNRLREYDLTSAQWAVLTYLHRQESCGAGDMNITPADIAEKIRVERPAVTRIVDKLLKGGWIEKRVNSIDRRSHNITLTPSAIGLMPTLKEIGEGVVEKSLIGISKDNMEQLSSVLMKIIENLD